MHFFTSLITTSFVAASALAAATSLLNVEKIAGETSGKLIVQLKSDASKADVLKQVGGPNVTHDWQLLNGFAGHFDSKVLNALRSNPNVKSIQEDGVVHAADISTQNNAPWGLSRLSSNEKITGKDHLALDFRYQYDTSSGSGVDIYILDTGILTTHDAFAGRARWGATFGPYADADGDGHGTQMAGIAAGGPTGVVKKANLIAVKALNDNGTGSSTDFISGLNWIKTQAASSGRPSVVNLSVAASPSSALDDAVNSLVDAGIYVAAAAGNYNTDAGNFSPARVPRVITVAASNIDDFRLSYSNYGSVVDVFAPGQDIISASIRSNTAGTSGSGTSHATAHVSGLIAYFIARDGNVGPASMSDKLKGLALKNVLSDIPSGTPNYLAHNA